VREFRSLLFQATPMVRIELISSPIEFNPDARSGAA